MITQALIRKNNKPPKEMDGFKNEILNVDEQTYKFILPKSALTIRQAS